MIPATLGTLMQAEPALERLGEVKLPAKVAYQIAKLTTLVKVETKHFTTERDKLIREMGETVQDGAAIQVPAAAMPEFTRKINELADVKTEIDWQPIQLEDLPEMTPSDIMSLGPFVMNGKP